MTLREKIREFVNPDHPEAPPDAESYCARMEAETLAAAAGRAITGYSTEQSGYCQKLTVHFGSTETI